jgi:phosphoglycolate phosphatase-like HAD superfamily hydrolase
VLELDLVRRHAPIVYFDAAEPFPPQLVGYAVLRASGPSPSFDRYLDLRLPDGGRAAAVVEYALWTDWDIDHLYELEHVWSYVDEDGHLLHAEASSHGGYGPLVQDGQLSREGERPVAYAQPGKHAMAPTADFFTRFDFMRERFRLSAERHVGRGGLLVGNTITGQIEKNARRDALANGFLRRRAFAPTFRFEMRWDGAEATYLPVRELIDKLPSRLEGVLHRLEVDRGKRRIWAVLFDLGDTLMDETTEEKDETSSTQRAELFPGAADTVCWLRSQGYLVGLVADTRPATYRNVLRQHGLDRAFDVLAISEELACEKPSARMFEHALERLGLRPDEAERVAMVGNNLGRDVRGARAVGMTSIWLHLNERYPIEAADDAERPDHEATSFDDLRRLIERLG